MASVPAPDAWLQTFIVRVGSRTLFVDAADMEWIDANDNYATLHANGREFLVRESLHRLAQRLDPASFVRVRRSTIVRVDQVVEMRALPNRDALLCLRDGTPITASRTYIDALTAHWASTGSPHGINGSPNCRVLGPRCRYILLPEQP